MSVELGLPSLVYTAGSSVVSAVLASLVYTYGGSVASVVLVLPSLAYMWPSSVVPVVLVLLVLVPKPEKRKTQNASIDLEFDHVFVDLTSD